VTTCTQLLAALVRPWSSLPVRPQRDKIPPASCSGCALHKSPAFPLNGLLGSIVHQVGIFLLHFISCRGIACLSEVSFGAGDLKAIGSGGSNVAISTSLGPGV
jgi:hypothetical protein